MRADISPANDSLEKLFEIRQRIGVGATAEVFQARRLRDDRIVALKVFLPVISQDSEAVGRIQQEVSVLQQLNHDLIVRLISFHENRSRAEAFGEDGQCKLALELEYVDGCSLKKWNSAFSCDLMEPRLWILSRIAKALGVAHEKRILHRDLKPENILISKAGEVKLTDFGLARSLERITMTKSGVLLGSLGYMAPEILNLETASERSDIFSFGVIAYELLTKQLPFEALSPQGVIKRLTEGKFTPLLELNPLVPKDVVNCIEACLSVEPSLRPENIWLVESVIMTSLARTPYMNYCQAIVGSQGREQALSQTLQLKLNFLTEKINSAVQTNGCDQIWRECQEYQRLFPQGELIPLIIEKILTQASPVQRRSRRLLVAVPLLLLTLLMVFFWIGFGDKDVTKPHLPGSVDLGGGTAIQTLKDKPSNQVPEAKVDQSEKPGARLPSAAKAPVKKKSEDSFINFEVPADVQVFVDNLPVPRDSLNRFKVFPGEKSIKMIKEGFLPIESKIIAEVGKTSTVRVGAQ